MDSTVHDLDICSWIAGAKPKTLYAQGSVFQRDKMPSGDNEQVVVVVTYENGAVSVTDNGRFCPFGYDQRMEVKILIYGDIITNHLGDNCIQNFHLERYIVGYTVEL